MTRFLAVHDFHGLPVTRFDTAHRINRIAFGDDFPGKQYPLDGKNVDDGKPAIMHNYYLNVVPTRYAYMDGRIENSHQFSVTSYKRDIAIEGAIGVPGFVVQYDFSPLMIQREEKRQQLVTFLVSLCAIIGGVYAVSQLIVTIIYHCFRVIEEELRLNPVGFH
ncbi:unnamed protein product [Cylicostephanus goldi]|uniref:Endoplasmic reticulum-Golgi intermediate compartment protein 3 n=1 Tax=Cylicostephanus goldi TaxID=71465 RepID=A0A3P6RXU4_CYLGO|nr:unnamed protein product [Cylicostephanus goldi]